MPSPQRSQPLLATPVRQEWQRVASTHTLEELLNPPMQPQRCSSHAAVLGCLLLAAGFLVAAAACAVLYQICAGADVPSDVQAWGHMPPALVYLLMLPCSAPVALVLVFWNWLSLKLFKFSV